MGLYRQVESRISVPLLIPTHVWVNYFHYINHITAETETFQFHSLLSPIQTHFIFPGSGLGSRQGTRKEKPKQAAARAQRGEKNIHPGKGAVVQHMYILRINNKEIRPPDFVKRDRHDHLSSTFSAFSVKNGESLTT